LTEKAWEIAGLMNTFIVDYTDSLRYANIWILWCIASGNKVEKYPEALPNERALDWAKRNLARIENSRIGVIPFNSI
jgi:hypothetical protein